MSNSRNVYLNHLKSRLKHINRLISSGKLSLMGHAIFENERKRVIEKIRVFEEGNLKNEV